MAAAAADQLIDKAVKAPHDRRYVLKCDNDATCAAANYCIASIVAMREALRIWLDTCGEHKTSARLLYIETSNNSIADALSRSEWQKASAGIRGRLGVAKI